MMVHRWAMAAALCALTAWSSRSAMAQAAQAHPSVVRVMATEKRGVSFGSGALVAVNRRYGLVLTNWHVVRDSDGFVLVTFPDGFRSPASVVAVDRDWDLAALAIWRPQAPPVAIAQTAPQIGEWLAIAGYGRGSYRMAYGQCTQYLSPGGRMPFEMVEVGTPAREGDSGGPIFNHRGELAGVLFGTGMGRTMGSYCGRVRAFVAPLFAQMEQMDRADEALWAAQQGAAAAGSETYANQPGSGPNQRGRPGPARWEPAGAGAGDRVAHSADAMGDAPLATAWPSAERPSTAAGGRSESPLPSPGIGAEAATSPRIGTAAPSTAFTGVEAGGAFASVAGAQSQPAVDRGLGDGAFSAARRDDLDSMAQRTAPNTADAVGHSPSNGLPPVASLPSVESSPPPTSERLAMVQSWLAVIGALLLVYHSLRLLGRAVG